MKYLLGIALLTAANAFAQTCNTTCGPGTGSIGKVCTVSFTGYDMTCGLGIAGTMVANAVNADCTRGVLRDAMATAAHPIASPATASCEFSFSYVTLAFGCAATQFVTCTVDAADGLPVELLEFSITPDQGVADGH